MLTEDQKVRHILIFNNASVYLFYIQCNAVIKIKFKRGGIRIIKKKSFCVTHEHE